jgi:hypothetical protein
MYIHDLHPWDVTPAEALRLQEALCGQVIRENRLGEVRAVAGVDVAVQGDLARAAVVVLRYPGLALLEIARAERPAAFPLHPRPAGLSRGARRAGGLRVAADRARSLPLRRTRAGPSPPDAGAWVSLRDAERVACRVPGLPTDPFSIDLYPAFCYKWFTR